jgi:hypothetical protein
MNKSKQKPARKPPDKNEMLLAFASSMQLMRRQWNALELLFVDSVQRGKLYAFAPRLCDAIHTALTVTLYLEIVKLHDPLFSNNDVNKSNLVLRRVIDEVAPPVGSRERAAIESDYDKMQPTIKKLKDWRIGFGAHKDLVKSLQMQSHLNNRDREPNPIPRIVVKELRECVDGHIRITDCMISYYLPDFQWYDDQIGEEVRKVVELVRE